MCGLYSLRKSPEETRALFGYDAQEAFPPRPHVAPGGPIAIVRPAAGRRQFALVRWGFVPSWAKEVAPGRPLITARGETAAAKPAFRGALRRRRCLIPADGFYEWQGDVPGRKQPWFIHRADDGLFAFAGLWEHWMGADGSELETAAVVTCAPNREIAAIRDRMPVVIDAGDHEAWLAGSLDEAQALIRPAPDGTFIREPTRIGRAAPPPPAPSRQLSLF